VTAVLLAIPALALAKTGVGFQTDPSEVKTGERQQFEVALFHEPRGPSGHATPYASHGRPLVTFTSASGRVVRVRAHRLLAGVSRGMVTFPDKGPWRTTISLGAHMIQDGGHSGGFGVGTAVPPETPSAPLPNETSGGGGGFAWWPFLFALPVLGVAAWLVRRRWPRGGLGEMGAGGSA